MSCRARPMASASAHCALVHAPNEGLADAATSSAARTAAVWRLFMCAVFRVLDGLEQWTAALAGGGIVAGIVDAPRSSRDAPLRARIGKRAEATLERSMLPGIRSRTLRLIG